MQVNYIKDLKIRIRKNKEKLLQIYEIISEKNYWDLYRVSFYNALKH